MRTSYELQVKYKAHYAQGIRGRNLQKYVAPFKKLEQY